MEEAAAPRPATPYEEPRLLREILTDLSKPIPDRLLKTRSTDGDELTYVPWHQAQRLFTFYTGGFWEYEVVDRTLTSEHILLTVRITLHHSRGTIHRDGTGIEPLTGDGFGDPQSNAEAMALRRAFAKFGLGLHLYRGE